jgi:endonuclease III
MAVLANAAPVDLVMRRLGRAILEMELPAIEKLQEDNASTAFQTLVATMLSAQTRDKVTHEASLRLFAVAPTPRKLAALSEDRIR